MQRIAKLLVFVVNCVVIESRVIVHFGSTVLVLVCGITVVSLD